MEKYVKALYDRLEGNGEAQNILFAIMDGAINEMHNTGWTQRVGGSLAESIHSTDPNVRIDAKSSLAKSVAYNECIVSSNPIRLKNGDIAHSIGVKYDHNLLNSIAICIQGGLEGLFQSNAYKSCNDGIMYYYIMTDAQGDELSEFRMKMMEIEGLYDNFQINFVPTNFVKQDEEVKENPSEDKKDLKNVNDTCEKKTGERNENKAVKTSFLKKLFKK